MDTRALGAEFFTKGRNPHGRNENSNTIYSSDPAHGSDARTGAHSRQEGRKREKTAKNHFQILITCMAFI